MDAPVFPTPPLASDDNSDKAPQQLLDSFWENLITKKPGKVTNIFPPSLYENLLPPLRKPGTSHGRNAAESYQAAADECRARVKRIVRECHRTNEKFTDPDFDIEGDVGINNCLEGLMNWYEEKDEIDKQKKSGSGPQSVHRIDWIFEKPSFTVDGFDCSDVQQGQNGDCWFIAAVAAICSNPSLMHKICVERDEECGVYGFVFYRDGEWIWTVVDDNLYLNSKDWAALWDYYDPTGAKERKYKRNEQTGSDALYFASCKDQNETWLPLLEKAYAKVHGDYDSIAGGISGEGVEDLTGGVNTVVMTNRILSKERLWKELLEVNKQFLFAASSPGSYGDDSDARKGLALSHAYSILKVAEEEDEDGHKHRLVQIRNPWGKRSWNGTGEWNGAWGDGSKEWTPYWMNKLNYRFGDDGVFWMAYDDLQSRFQMLDRTRLFDKHWTVVQLWTSVSVAWVTGYLNTKFLVEIKKAGPTVFVLSQLDERYFVGLEGKYRFDLHFLLQEEGAPAGEHIVRARGAWFGNRSISAEVDLEPGKYEVLPKIVAWKDDDEPDVYDVVQKLADKNPQKLRQIGMNYDIANAKGMTEEEKKERMQSKKEKDEKKRKENEEKEKERAEFEAWRREKKGMEQKEKEKVEKEKVAKEKADKEKAEKEKAEKEKAEKDKAEKEQAEKEKAEQEKADKEKAEKEKAEKEQKEMTEEEREKAEFEAWRREKKERIETETAAKEQKKGVDEAQKEHTDKAESEKTETAKEGEKPESSKEGEKTETAQGEDKKEDTKVDEASKPNNENPETAKGEEKKEDPAPGESPKPTSESDKKADSKTEDADKKEEPKTEEQPGAATSPSAPDLVVQVQVPGAVVAPAPVEEKQKPWNAVCVLGLRVYAKDSEVSIRLVKPSAEEGAVLDADGATQAGATM